MSGRGLRTSESNEGADDGTFHEPSTARFGIETGRAKMVRLEGIDPVHPLAQSPIRTVGLAAYVSILRRSYRVQWNVVPACYRCLAQV